MAEKNDRRMLRKDSNNSTPKLTDITTVAQVAELVQSLSNKIDTLETNITTAIDNKISSVIKNVYTQIEKLNKRLDAVEKAMEEKINTGLNQIKEMTNVKISALETNIKQEDLSDIDERLMEMERMNYSCDLIINGVPQELADLKIVFKDIARAIKSDIDFKCINNIFRCKSGSIILKFNTSKPRDSFFKNYLKLRNLNTTHLGSNESSRIYINECLGKKTAALLKIAQQMRRDGWLHSTHTHKGYLYITKQLGGDKIKIVTKNQLISSESNGHTSGNTRRSISRFNELLTRDFNDSSP